MSLALARAPRRRRPPFDLTCSLDLSRCVSGDARLVIGSALLRNRRLRVPLAWPGAIVGALLAGCGSERAVKTVPVEGVVRLESGPWPAGGNISFVSLEAAPGYPLRPGWAVFDREGKFSAGCFEDGDGLVPGTYAVNIDCWDVSQQRGGKQTTGSCIPTKYQRGFQELAVPADASEPLTVEWVIPAK